MKIGNQTIKFESKPCIFSTSSMVGPKEFAGPLANYFDQYTDDIYFGEKTFEKAESRMLNNCLKHLLGKNGINENDIDLIFSGDLLNQCISSSFAVRDLNIPYLGLYGACSTFCEGLLLSSLCIESNCAKQVIACASSHFCSAERQYRMPLEHGNQKSTTAQATVTGCGAALITDSNELDNGIHITHATPGKIIDLGVKDMSNMGAAMAPAVYSTIANHLNDTKRDLSYYDLVITGDLGIHGSDMLYELFKRENIDIRSKHKDCGALIYDAKVQDVVCGGSGCGCVASVFSSYIFNELKNKNLNKILLIATGALMSPISSNQGETIPSIAHAIAIENEVSTNGNDSFIS